MASRMTSEQLAALKGNAKRATTLRALAKRANGHTGTRVEARQAQQQLEQVVGKRQAAKLREAEIRSAGGGPKGFLGRLLG